MTDLRQHRSRKPTGPTERGPQPTRCRPTLFARFVDGYLTSVEHRHIARRPITESPTFRSTPPPPFDEGCRGPCVGRRDVLPRSYLDKGAR